MTSQAGFEPASAGTLPERLATLYVLIADDVGGLNHEQLDWDSQRWEWSKWSIRRQLSHMASVSYGWLCTRFGDQLFPSGLPEEYTTLTSMSVEERIALNMSLDLDGLLARLRGSMGLAEEVARRETLDSMRAKAVSMSFQFPWDGMARAHPTGVDKIPGEANAFRMDLEGTLRHIYYELVTHLYNIQRLMRAQGLTAHGTLPAEGYWRLPDWDRSEP